MFGKLICWVTRKHKRGKRVGMPVMAANGNFYQTYSCPRCHATGTRKWAKKEQA